MVERESNDRADREQKENVPRLPLTPENFKVTLMADPKLVIAINNEEVKNTHSENLDWDIKSKIVTEINLKERNTFISVDENFLPKYNHIISADDYASYGMGLVSLFLPGSE